MLSLGAKAKPLARGFHFHWRKPPQRTPFVRTNCTTASSSCSTSTTRLGLATTTTTTTAKATKSLFVSAPSAALLAKRIEFLLAQQQYHKNKAANGHSTTTKLHCLALSAAAIASQKRSISIQELIDKLLTAFRMLKHLCKLLALTSPLMVAAPIVYVARKWKPEVENLWWNYALFAARHSSPTFMKFLQWASARRDMFPAEFCDRFESFHENAPFHSWPKTEEALTMAFGEQWRDLFDIDPTPIGSGCIAQVYRARLKSTNPEKNGQEVAIKVIHPHVKQMIQFDLVFMEYCVSAMVTMIPSLKTLSMRDSLSEFAGIMNRQVNLRTEAENLKQFAHHFGEDDAVRRLRFKKNGSYSQEYQQQQHSYDEQPVRFPVPLMEYTCESVLVETLENGMHFQEFLHKVDVKEKKKIAKLLLESYLRMLFLHNFAHGDLHPGNLLFETSQLNDKLKVDQVVLVDAGIVTSLDREDLNNFVELLHAVATGNGYHAGELIVSRNRQNHPVFGDKAQKTELGTRVVKGSADLKATSHSVGYMDAIMGPQAHCQDSGGGKIDDNQQQQQPQSASELHKDSFCRGVERIVSKSLQWNLRLSHVHVGSLLRDVMELCCAHNVRLEGKYASIVVSIGVLESVGKRVDPDIDLLSIALPILIESKWKYIKQRKQASKC